MDPTKTLGQPTSTNFKLCQAENLGSFLARLPITVFGPARQRDDRDQLGWRLIQPNRRLVIDAHALEIFAADAAVLAGLIVELLGDQVEILQGTSRSLQPVSLIQSASSEHPADPALHLLPSGAYATGVIPLSLSGENTLGESARLVCDLAFAAPAASKDAQSVHLRGVLRRVVYEALLNVFEHAYTIENEQRAWVTVTMTPLPMAKSLHQNDTSLTPKEQRWFESVTAPWIVEVCVGDIGVGIPERLALNGCKHIPGFSEEYKQFGAGQREFRNRRANMHQVLCDHAFRHYSTSKSDDRFHNEHHRLNWRGLYRCYRQVMDLGGCIALTSGRGRAGYASIRDRAMGFQDQLSFDNEIPGTMFLIRLPVGGVPEKRASIPRISPNREPVHLAEVIVSWHSPDGHSQAKLSPTKTEESIQTQFIGLAMPFCEFTDGNEELKAGQIAVSVLRKALEQFQQHEVPVICFGDMESHLKHGLRAGVPLGQGRVALGTPRLTAFLRADACLEWSVAGLIPEEFEREIRELEEEGRTGPKLETDALWLEFAEELEAHYRDLLVFDPTSGVLAFTRHLAP